MNAKLLFLITALIAVANTFSAEAEVVPINFVGSWFVSASNTKEKAMALSEEVMGRTYVPVGGQFWYQALDDNGNLGALRVGTAF